MPSVYFLDGPCDGEKINVSTANLAKPYLTCKDNIYRFDGADSGGKHPIVYKWAGATSGGGGGSGSLTAPHALKGWKSLRRSVNADMPRALAESQRLRQSALRSLSRARKVRP